MERACSVTIMKTRLFKYIENICADQMHPGVQPQPVRSICFSIIQILTLSMLRKNSADNILKYFTHKETICMKCQSLISGKNKESISLPSADLAQRLVKVKYIAINDKLCRELKYTNI